MKNDFPRILTLLRKEKGFSQKEAAARFNISQALLSHYEKGIRECGLDFVVTVADEYNVSLDYLLGRTSDRQGTVISISDIPEADESKDKTFNGSIVATVHKKLIMNSIAILFDLLQSPKLKDFTAEAGSYLGLALYKIFRILYSSNPSNPTHMFAIRDSLSGGLSNAAMQVSEAYLTSMRDGNQIGDMKPVCEDCAPEITPELLSKNYPQHAGSLFNLISSAETRMGAKPKK